MNQSSRPLSAFLRLGRLKFLFETMVIVALGVTLAVTDGYAFDLHWYLATMLFAWCIHLMTHYCNEYFDLDADRANEAPTAWTGGSRVLVSGQLSPIVSLSAAFVLLFVGVCFIAVMPNLPARLLGIASMALAWFYTAPPLRLNYRGLGEFAAAAVSYGLGPFLAYRLQGGGISPLSAYLIGMVFAVQFFRLTTMNLSDSAGDRAAGKRTLAVILGERRLVELYIGGETAVYSAVVLLTVLHVVPVLVGVLLLLTAAVPIWVGRSLLTGAMDDGGRRARVTFWSSAHLPICASAIILGLLVNRSLNGHAVSTAWLGICSVTLLAFGFLLVQSSGRDNRRPRPVEAAAPSGQ